MSCYNFGQFDTYISIISTSFVGGYMGALSETSRSRTQITHYPVEDNFILSDHVHILPFEIDFSIIVSGDAKYDLVFNALRALQLSRVGVDITTNVTSYPNMILTDVSANNTPAQDASIIDIKAVEVQSVYLGYAGLIRSVVNTTFARRKERHGRTHNTGRVKHKEGKVIRDQYGNFVRVDRGYYDGVNYERT